MQIAKSLAIWTVLFFAAIGLGAVLGLLIATIWNDTTGAVEHPMGSPDASSRGWGA